MIKNIAEQRGFLKLPNDSMAKTLAVAICLCLVCSVIVSTAATLLKPAQVANKLIDKKRNIVAVAGLADPSRSVDESFAQIETRVVDLASGEYTDAVDAQSYDQRKAAKDPETSQKLAKNEDLASIGRRADYASVYLLKDGDALQKVILPIKGYGLWSTMYGFVALEADAQTVAGITFYEHGETPGLGGEIENTGWQQSWQGKQVFNQQGEPALHLIKGQVDTSASGAQFQIDGLAGATLTSNGVSNLIKFWMGENGFGPYLQRLRGATQAQTEAAQFDNDQLSSAVNNASLNDAERG